ncbi:MAG: hypothetical protein QOK07_2822, partial [Gemmatimonadaceae bacterium]|nr:hypothetical protein [Gemmatimonadaceae bacterium]
MPVTVSALHTRDRGPELEIPRPLGGKCCLLPRVRM